MRIDYEELDAISVFCKCKSDDVQEQALIWMSLYNSAQNNKSTFYKVDGCYENSYLYINPDMLETVLDYLKSFDVEVTSVENTKVIKPVAHYTDDEIANDYDEYEFAEIEAY